MHFLPIIILTQLFSVLLGVIDPSACIRQRRPSTPQQYHSRGGVHPQESEQAADQPTPVHHGHPRHDPSWLYGGHSRCHRFGL